jgi:hypothetical protein
VSEGGLVGAAASGPSGAPTSLERELARQLATLVHAIHGEGGGQPEAPAPGRAAGSGGQQAVSWWNLLASLGLEAPLVVVHDLGLLLTRGPEREGLLARAAPAIVDPGLAPPRARYVRALTELASARIFTELESTVLRDEVVAALLYRLLGDLPKRLLRPPVPLEVGPLPLLSPSFFRPLAELAAEHDPGWCAAWFVAIADRALALLVRLEQTQLSALRLLRLMAPESALPEVLDLIRILDPARVGPAADFSLALLPALLEAKRSSSAQRLAIDGYASVERRGSLDALLPSELALDPEIFDQRALGDELLFYGHERPHEARRRVHAVLVDASASMRGVREVFARGLGLALCKRLQLEGTEVWFSFFANSLGRRVDGRLLGGRELPYLLGFRSDLGRNYRRVFEQLRAELTGPREPAVGASHTSVTFITHGECRIPAATVEALAAVASLHAVFVLPSRPLDLPYLDLLAGYETVTADSLGDRGQQKRRALEVVEGLAGASASGVDAIRAAT